MFNSLLTRLLSALGEMPKKIRLDNCTLTYTGR
jgi:hypothetical protein